MNENQRLCVWCGEPIPLEDRTSPRQKYHTGQCQREVKRAWQRANRDRKHGKPESPEPEFPPEWNVPQPSRVMCLGIREPEHFFMSPDPLRVRVCQSCKRLSENLIHPETYGGFER
jgi:hypothetical protein